MPMSGITKSSGGMMRRFMSVALIGLAVAGTTTVAAAQSLGGGQAAPAGRADVRGGAGGSDSVRGRRGGPGGARAALAGLSLSSTQKSQIKTINKKYADQFKQLRQANGTNAGAQNANARVQMQAIAERERAEIRGVLTPEQRTQFDANVAKQRGKGKAGLRTKPERN
jgi:Spy/CpxP family protein refolding chaperone